MDLAIAVLLGCNAVRITWIRERTKMLQLDFCTWFVAVKNTMFRMVYLEIKGGN